MRFENVSYFKCFWGQRSSEVLAYACCTSFTASTAFRPIFVNRVPATKSNEKTHLVLYLVQTKRY